MLRYIILFPLLGAVVNWLVGRKTRNEMLISIVGCGTIALSMVVSFYVAFFAPNAALRHEAPVLDHLWTWIQVGAFRADFGLAMDRLSGIYACFITFVGFLIHLFATGYMHDDDGFYRFFAYLNLFMFSMLTLILGDNFLLMFVGWEGVGLCSYLLIGYYVNRPEAGAAAKKAFIVNRIGDWGVVLGVALIFYKFGTISFFNNETLGIVSVFDRVATLQPELFGWGTLFAGGVTTIAFLLFIGATGKSAQIPLYVWLPDAMAGPTPVSALIHAATMVTAGVYMVVRCNVIYTHAPTAMYLVAIIGALTAIVAATIGLAQNDIKKVLAYSTVSQLGYMFLACGVGAFAAAIFHVMMHAFFKALLFLGSGSVIHGMHHEQDMRFMGGLKKYMPITFATMLTGWLAICGVFPFAGFFSKDEILWKTWDSGGIIPGGKILWVIGAVTALLTAVYMTRMMVMTFWGDARFKSDAAAHHHETVAVNTNLADTLGDGKDAEAASVKAEHVHYVEHPEDDPKHAPTHHQFIPHESPWNMTVPLIALAILSTLGGFLGVSHALSSLPFFPHVPNVIEETLEPVIRGNAPHELKGGANLETSNATHPSPVARVNKPDAPPATLPVFYQAPAPAQEPAAEPPHSAPPAANGAAENATAPGEPHAPAEEHDPGKVRTERWFTLASLGIALAGIGLGWFMFRNNPLRKMPTVLENKYYVDEAYDTAIIKPILLTSREGFWKLVDVGMIDWTVNAVGRTAAFIGNVSRYLQSGYVRNYAAFLLFGALFVIGYFIYRSLPLLMPGH